MRIAVLRLSADRKSMSGTTLQGIGAGVPIVIKRIPNSPDYELCEIGLRSICMDRSTMLAFLPDWIINGTEEPRSDQ